MTFRNELVSIVMPAYQAAHYIEETITSVQEQTCKDWEMLIVDDHSSDRTHAIASQFARGDGRIRAIRLDKNKGPATARNTALKEAGGRWIAFLDSDDLWLPSKLEQQLSLHAEFKPKMSFTEFRRISGDGKNVGRRICVPNQLTYRTLLRNTAIATSTVMVDRALVHHLSMKNMYYDDFGCWLDILRDGGYAMGLHEDQMRYRVLDGSVSRSKIRSSIEVWKTFRKAERLGIVSSSLNFVCYAVHGIAKYYRF